MRSIGRYAKDRLPLIRAARLHLQVGKHQEVAYGKHSARVAGELAIHFERGGDIRRAIQYRMIAADKALHTFAANKEAADHLTQALQLMRQHPEVKDIPEEKLIQALLATVKKGEAAPALPDPEELKELTFEIGGEIGDKNTIFQARVQAWMLNLLRAKFEQAREMSAHLLRAAESMGQQARMQAELAAGTTSFYLGEFPQACEHLEQAGTAAEVQEGFDTAIATAQKQVNRSGELRILTAVVRQSQEPWASSARARLKEAYGWFSEGFETSDLVNARALILGTNTLFLANMLSV